VLNAISRSGQGAPLTFARDHHLRRYLGFAESSFEHKAKANLNWLAWLINTYTDPGDTILDPLAGTGSTLLAALNGRPTVAGDVEPYWASLLDNNARRLTTHHLIIAPILTAQWDAARLPVADQSVGAIVASPPYFDLFSDWNRKQANYLDGRHVGPNGLCYGDHPHQIGNLHIYEDYLRAMRAVYLECARVLRPSGKLLLILGDKVRESRIVPVTEDTLTLTLAIDLHLLATHDRQTIPSRWRLIHQHQQQNYPLITGETALVLKKPRHPDHQPKHLFIIEAPNGDSSPGQILFHKQLTYCLQQCDRLGPVDHLILILDSAGPYVASEVPALFPPDITWTGDHPRKARARREWSCAIVRDLVADHYLRAGDPIELHITDRYARYLEQRLNTLGAVATIPTAHHNLGQKLAWYTERVK
jgi:SAM-dependent methyltransferase